MKLKTLAIIFGACFSLNFGIVHAQPTNGTNASGIPTTIPFNCTVKVTNNTPKAITFKDPAFNGTVNPGSSTQFNSSNCRLTSTTPVNTTLSNGTTAAAVFDPSSKTVEVRIAGMPRAVTKVEIGAPAKCVAICPSGGNLPCYCDF